MQKTSDSVNCLRLPTPCSSIAESNQNLYDSQSWVWVLFDYDYRLFQIPKFPLWIPAKPSTPGFDSYSTTLVNISFYVIMIYASVQIINHVSPKSWFWENSKKQFQCLHSYFIWNKLTNSSKTFWLNLC